MAKKTIASSEATASQAPEPVTTQRAYTLRLRGAQPTDRTWRDALWATHEAINEGAKAFGDWLLTLRGGLSHELAQPPSPGGKKKRSEGDTDALRKNRRILLALSWLSVEDEHGAPTGDVRVATGSDAPAAREGKVVAALRKILKARGVSQTEVDSWVADCGPSLSAAIREDAVWINRSACFDSAVKDVGKSLTRDDVWDFLEPFFGGREAYLTGIDAGADDASEPSGSDEKAKDLVQKAGQWLSSRFGTGGGADFSSMATAYRKMATWSSRAQSGKGGSETISRLADALGHPSDGRNLNAVLAVISGPGYKSATRNHLKQIAAKSRVAQADLDRLNELAQRDAAKCEANTGRKGRRPWADRVLQKAEAACGFSYLQMNGPARHREFSVMLDHAARRVSIAHSWIKRAEAERQRFTEDANRINCVPAAARAWLDKLCSERSETSGAVGEYRIRRRAIESWDDIVRRWSRSACKTIADRIAAAREVQADPETEKFGDIQLFEALAAEDAECVWRVDSEATPDPLKDYVAATDALAKQRRFKVPAYRHPDPLAHPVFGDFGKSRWDIRFAVHEAAKAARGDKRVAEDEKEWIKGRHGLRMGLWDGHGVRAIDLRWSSKRLVEDLALRDVPDDQQSGQVPRADRLGRAAAGLSADEAARVAGLFELPDWNGRLQAPRAELDDIWNRVVKQKKGWDTTARAMRDRIGWLVSFSAKLQCRGPFVEFAAQHGIKPNRKGEYFPHGELNKREGREGHAKLVISRLPGLRVLSVDLGHRYAGACAVWEALSPSAFRKQIAACKVLAGGAGRNDLFLHIGRPGRDGKPRTIVFRRIAADTLSDGSPHPAPWARLDRQFLIKLQGEDLAARAASPAETAAVQQLETELGRVRGKHDPLPRRVDALMGEAVRTVRLAIRRHGDAARIAYAFKTDAARLTPGGGAQPHTPETRGVAVLDALLRWYELATGARWHDAWAAAQWTARVQPHVGAALPALADDADRWERKRHRAALEQALRPVAGSLNERKTADYHRLWSSRWSENDRAWPARLRWLRDWLLPRGLRARRHETEEQAAARRARRGSARNVGGLSLTRMATLRELYQLQKAYAMRPEPDDPRKRIAAKGDDRYDEFGRSVLQVVERLREQRVKQLASRIVEAALGVGRVKPADGRGCQRPQCRVDAPCHAVVIESLRNYRPDELQTRRENRALMNWSAGKVRKYLEEACQLHGLHLREVMPNYTSRQDSRTGLPGVRCDDVPIDEFLTAPWWRKAVNAAKKKTNDGATDSLEMLLVALDDRWSKASAAEKLKQKTLRLPRRGGDLFVAAPPRSCSAAAHTPYLVCRGARALQADLNAAANIGLRALMDPDFPGKWWYVPCSDDKQAGVALPRTDKVKGAACFRDDPAKFGSLFETKASAESTADGQAAREGKSDRKTSRRGKGERRSRGEGKETTNYWGDPSGRDLRPADKGGFWLPTTVYWKWVRKRAVAALHSLNGLSPPAATALEPDADLR